MNVCYDKIPAPSDLDTPFVSALRSAIADQVEIMKRDGVTAVSDDCLRQLVRPPSEFIEGAPRGAHATFYYAELFRGLCDEPSMRSFVSLRVADL